MTRDAVTNPETGETERQCPARRLEARFEPTFVARLALREKQVQQSYRPIISIHKWFARRPGSVFRSLLLSEFGQDSLSSDYFKGHSIRGVMADPFMGGGTTVFEAARLGLSLVGGDVNPMAYWTVRQGVSPLDLELFQSEAQYVIANVHEHIGHLYQTRCTNCFETAEVKYFHHVKTCDCPSCGEKVDLFPGLRLAEAVRHPREVYHCQDCDALREVERSSHPHCPECGFDLKTRPASRSKATCQHCSEHFKFTPLLASPPRHRPFGIEYHCRTCYDKVDGRQFKTPDTEDLARIEQASELLYEWGDGLVIPDDAIQSGDETNRLHRWGYKHWRDLFSDRQLLGLGLLMRRIGEVSNNEVRYALATVFSDFLRYQNLLCRYDTYALKCQDIFAVHGFPVALLACENNLLGISKVGSGSFEHFVGKYVKAKQYAKQPYEITYVNNRKNMIPIVGESIEAPLTDSEPTAEPQAAWIASAPSQKLSLRSDSLDGVFTDPPYFDNVQYAELMDFCYVWLRRFMRAHVQFSPDTTRTDDELTGNVTRLRGIQEFASGLSEVFCQMSYAMKPGAPLVFTYHHNESEAYVPLIIAILDAGLTCTETLVAPGEMSASLHITGTKSSILDTVFVCRAEDVSSEHPRSVKQRVEADVEAMRKVPYKPTEGDIACLEAGHIAASAIRHLRATWDPEESLEDRFETAMEAVRWVRNETEGTYR
ncbi:hypothetical protein [Haloactinomyces albus]|uniref:Adenine-specific DNA methylase n=1 Tax=Haloactinomyces albus TaxID=1352928 RepID=A0AAE3ZD88_9ACTN|nr:hypothetical protein [Haloactinomyces albus]MDR7301399.1 adenine-specific DNA methylase [Haloactinomyces albus]